MKISTIELTNFQIHKHIVIDISNGLNVITGDNDAGKSSIVRALNWLINNNPSGDWMRKIDKNGNLTTASVKVTLENGTVIERVKGKNINKYVLDGVDSEDIGVQKFPKIDEVFGFSKAFEKLDVFPYLSMQDDPQFMVSMKGSERAAIINTMTGIDIVENTIREFNRKKMNVNKLINNIEIDIEENKIDIATYDNVEMLEGKIEKLNALVVKLKRNESHLDILKKYRIEKSTALSDLQKYEPVDLDDKFEKTSELFKRHTELTAENKKLREFSVLYEEFYDIKPIADLDKNISKIEKLIDKHESVEKHISNVKWYKEEYERANVDKGLRFNILSKAEHDLKQYDGKACPVCGKTMEEKHCE